MTLYVGIDPGKSGYISFYSTESNELKYKKLPNRLSTGDILLADSLSKLFIKLKKKDYIR